MASIGDLKVLIGANIDPLLKNLKQAEKNIQMTARNMQAVGDSMLKLTAPILGVATVSFKMAADFDDGMRKVQAVSGATGEELEKLRDMALEMGKSTRFGATESAAAMNYMGQAGWNTQQIMSGLPGVLALAAASGEDLAMVSDIVTDGLTGFKLAAEDSGRFADVLAKAAAASNTNVAMMGETFKYVSPVAGALGFSIEDTAVAIGLMANAGIKGSQAGTALRAMISRMVKPVGESAKAMEQLGLSVTDADGKMKPMSEIITELRNKFSQLTPAQQAQMAASIAGQEAMSGMLALVSASDTDFTKLTEQINNSAGAAQEMADTMEGGAGGGLRRMQKALEGAAISLGDAFAPMIEKVVEKITQLANWFTSLSKETKETILQVTLIVAGLGAAFKVIGLVISGVGSMVATFKSLYTVFKIVNSGIAVFNAILIANPIGAIIAGVTALIAIITAAIVKYEKWGAAVLLLMGPLGMIINLIQSFRRHWDSIVSAFKTDGILAGLKRIGIVMLDAVLMPLQQLLELASKIPGIGNLAAKGAEKIEQMRQKLNLIEIKPEKIEKAVKETSRKISEAVDPAQLAIDVEAAYQKGLAEGMLKGAENAAKNATGPIKDATKKAVETGVTQGLTEAQKALTVPLQSIGSSMFSNMFGSNMDFTRGLQEEKQPGGISSLSGDTSGQAGLIGLMDGALGKLTGTMTRMGEASQEAGQVAGESFQFMYERLQDMAASGDLTANLVMAIGSSIMNAAEQGADGMKSLASAALDAGAKVVRSFIMQGVASAVSNALKSVPFPLNLAAGAMAGAAAGVLFNSLINKIRAPKLAKGGLAYGPTMAMVGDNPGANVDPEVISPLSKLKDMINSQVTVNLAGSFMLRGQDLWLAVEKESVRQRRLSGS